MSLLQVKDLSKQFGELKAVDRINFSVAAGEIYGLLGPNGAGKTTTISMLSGLLKPDHGQVLIEQKDFWSRPEACQRIMGVVPQDVALYEELSGEENLVFWGRMSGLPHAEARKQAERLLEALALADRARELVKHYSGGMKRRINLGCALVHRPRLLLLDEPTVGIDPQARQNILDFVRDLTADGTAVLYTTHYLEEAETLCRRIGIIDQGKLLAEGSLAELQERLGRDRLFVLEGDFRQSDPSTWPAFQEKYRIILTGPEQITVASRTAAHPSECLKDLLEIPAPVDNVMVKKPSLNEVFLQLTGRELRE